MALRPGKISIDSNNLTINDRRYTNTLDLPSPKSCDLASSEDDAPILPKKSHKLKRRQLQDTSDESSENDLFHNASPLIAPLPTFKSLSIKDKQLTHDSETEEDEQSIQFKYIPSNHNQNHNHTHNHIQHQPLQSMKKIQIN